MKYHLRGAGSRFCILLLAGCLFIASACKKNSKEVVVDAFAQLNNEVKYNQGVYNILFTLHDYPYSEVGVRIATDKTTFKNVGLTTYPGYMVSANRWGIFLNSLPPDKIHYYQIYVKDSAGSKSVYSEIFSFKTNP